MAIVYIAAEAMELKPFAARLDGLRNVKWPLDYAVEGILDGRRVLLIANGAGPALASRAFEVAIRALTLAELSSSKLEAVVSTGFCGALDPALREFSIVIADAIRDSDSAELVPCDIPVGVPEQIAMGAIYSQNRIANSADEKQRLHATGAIAVDMESSALLERARREQVPFYCIRVVSDRADESFVLDLNGMRTHEGRIARGKIVTYGLVRPPLWPKLWRLKKRADEAANRLGEFLVSCRIQPDSDVPSAP
jgi:nucleoside phosphorylase